MKVIHVNFQRSKQSISKYFHAVLNGVLRLQGDYFKTPVPIPNNSTDKRWKYFQNCLGALDGTHIKMHIPVEDRAKYRNRRGTYYLVDVGYTNGEGFLAPYRGQRYHLNYWKSGRQPTSARENFNTRHSSARNAIERCFGILKKRWAILRSPSFYPVKIQNRIVLVCCVLHNYIRTEMIIDPEEIGSNKELEGHNEAAEYEVVPNYIISIGVSNEWTAIRDNFVDSMFNE